MVRCVVTKTTVIFGFVIYLSKAHSILLKSSLCKTDEGGLFNIAAPFAPSKLFCAVSFTWEVMGVRTCVSTFFPLKVRPKWIIKQQQLSYFSIINITIYFTTVFKSVSNDTDHAQLLVVPKSPRVRYNHGLTVNRSDEGLLHHRIVTMVQNRPLCPSFVR